MDDARRCRHHRRPPGRAPGGPEPARQLGNGPRVSAAGHERRAGVADVAITADDVPTTRGRDAQAAPLLTPTMSASTSKTTGAPTPTGPTESPTAIAVLGGDDGYASDWPLALLSHVSARDPLRERYWVTLMVIFVTIPVFGVGPGAGVG